MKKIMITILSAVALVGCGGGHKASVPAIDTNNFDTSVALNEDFYNHFTGGWQKAHPLRPEYARYGAMDLMRENNEYRIKELFAEIEKSEAAQGSVEQKIADLYRLGMDSVRLNREGVEPLAEELAAISDIANRKDLARVLGTMHASVCNPFFAIGVSIDAKQSDKNALYIAQAGLGLGNRDYYTAPEHEHIRTEYAAYIERICTLAGYSAQEAARIRESVLEIEHSLANKHFTNVERRNPEKNYNKLSLAELKRSSRGFDWDGYAEAMGFEMPAEVIIMQKPAINEAMRVIAKSDLNVIKDYLTFNTIRSASNYLNDALVEASFDFFGRILSGKQEQQPRWKRALAVPNETLSEAVGELYVAKHFPAEYKAKMLEIVDNLQVALGQHIDALEWMSDQTKAKAHEKLAAFTVKVGYPDEWKDYSSLTIDAGESYWKNIKTASAWYTADNLADLKKPVDRSRWLISPQTVNAYYNPTTNEICFPAAILQPPFFNPDADDAVNYGAIGVVIGHEMTHGFDDQGRQYDKDGNIRNWWTQEDADAFNKLADKLVAQFDAIEVAEGLNANGRFTLGENIADQGGLRVSYTALQNAMAQNGRPENIDGYTPEQRFYISYATIWGQNIREQEIRRLTQVDPHSLGMWRVNGTLPNIDTFHEAFGITEGAMYRPAEERVIIW